MCFRLGQTFGKLTIGRMTAQKSFSQYLTLPVLPRQPMMNRSMRRSTGTRQAAAGQVRLARPPRYGSPATIRLRCSMKARRSGVLWNHSPRTRIAAKCRW